jgi:hypothetical protein
MLRRLIAARQPTVFVARAHAASVAGVETAAVIENDFGY